MACSAGAGEPYYGRCQDVSEYDKVARIGEGTYGTVYKALRRRSGSPVALKKVKIDPEVEREGMPLTALREVQLLRRVRHRNLVSLRGIAVGQRMDSVFLIFEYCEHDLAALVDHLSARFTEAEVKCITLQLLDGLAALHGAHVVHRDVKPSNILYCNHGQVKLCDFGLARIWGDPPRRLSPGVVTLWYRAPELLLGAARYSVAVDVWSAGCVWAELLLGRPLLPGSSEQEQLQLTADLLGTPTSGDLAEIALPAPAEDMLAELRPRRRGAVRDTLPELGAPACSFLTAVLAYCPAQRPSAAAARRHSYFSAPPAAAAEERMPSFPSLHGTNPRRDPPARKARALAAPAAPPHRGVEKRRAEGALSALLGRAAAAGPAGVRPMDFGGDRAKRPRVHVDR